MTQSLRKHRFPTAIVAVCCLALGLVWSMGPAKAQETPAEVKQSLEHAQSLSKAFRYVAEEAAPSVVAITTRTKAREIGGNMGGPDPFEEFRGTPFEDLIPEEFRRRLPREGRKFRTPPRTGLGSGMIIDEKGIILTNRHVVDGADDVVVRLNDGREFKATDVKTDTGSDLAIVRIEGATGLQAVKLGDSKKMEIGDWVVAIGNPFGLDLTVTAGIISNTSRGLNAGEGVNYLQTDAAINPGNSGGPLFNLNGEVIGINTAIASNSGGFQGVGFAIPSDTAKWVSRQLIEKGEVQRAYLGVVIQRIDNDLAQQFDVKPNDGVLVSQVMEGSPAAKAGLQTGDIITHFAKQRVSNPRELQAVVQQLPFGSDHPVKILRNGSEKTLEVTVKPQPEDFVLGPRSGQENGKSQAPSSTHEAAGLEVSELTAEVAEQLEVEATEGVVITSVKPGSLAAQAGLTAGNVITQVAGKTVNNLDDFEAAMKEASLEKGILMLVRDGTGSRFVVLRQR